MKELTIMDTIVKYSKECIVIRFVKNYFVKGKLLTRMLPIGIRVPSINTVDVPIAELDFALKNIETDIGRLLTPLFEGKDFNFPYDGKFSLSVSEMRDGYILLKEVAKREPITNNVISYKQDEYVILLRPLKSHNSSFVYSPGVLYALGSGVTEEDLKDMVPSDRAIIANDLLNIIINKKLAYEYFKRIRTETD
jgi:hypothetical protein